MIVCTAAASSMRRRGSPSTSSRSASAKLGAWSPDRRKRSGDFVTEKRSPSDDPGGLGILGVSCRDDARFSRRQIESMDRIAPAAAVRRERQPSPVGREPRLAAVVRAAGPLLQPRAVGPDGPYVEISRAIGLEAERLAVRRPIRLRDVAEIVGEPPRDACLGAHHPENSEQIESDPSPIGRSGRGDIRALAQRDVALRERSALPWRSRIRRVLAESRRAGRGESGAAAQEHGPAADAIALRIGHAKPLSKIGGSSPLWPRSIRAASLYKEDGLHDS